IDGDAKQVQPLLQVIPGVCMVEVNPYGQDNQDKPKNHSFLRITCSPGAQPGRDIATVITNVGLGLYEMRRTRPTLEEVFLELTTTESVISDALTPESAK
ncbi:MAG: ABC transporter ATP-binding protein, partial [Moorea sp. SIO2B7]|nr:ABC transporter ATP-binding protein [Moorena sp. SIO2B7]